MRSMRPGVHSSVHQLRETFSAHVTRRNLFFPHGIRPSAVGQGRAVVNRPTEIEVHVKQPLGHGTSRR